MTVLTRRHALLTLAGATAACTPDWPMNGDRLHADVEKYVSLGEHRTGTPGDQLTSEWLRGNLRISGYHVDLQEWTVPTFYPGDVHVLAGNDRIPAFPLWPVRAAASVEGPLGTAIGVARVQSPLGALSRQAPLWSMIEAARAQNLQGLIVVTEGPTGEAIALNHESGVEEWPLPIVLVGSRYAEPILRGFPGAKPVRIVIAGKPDPAARATNVVARFGSAGKYVVVSTPKSGWFRCGGERGPGIALWLGLARYAANHPGPFRYLFTANSGHELHDHGMQQFRKSVAPPPSEVACWIHFGAGIATWAWQNGKKQGFADPRRALQCTPDLAPLLAPEFSGIEGLRPQPNTFFGELRHLDGYRRFGVAAAHRFHHVVTDDASNTGPEILEPVGKAFVRVLEKLQQS